jgi:hypothetical protein
VDATDTGAGPSVPVWQLNVLRICYLLMALVMGSVVWSQLLFHSAGWPAMQGTAKSMLAALALLSLLGARYPLQMLPLMLYELAWKTIWMGVIAYPAWATGRMTPDIEGLFYDCIGVVVFYVFVPWRYVWFHYIQRQTEPWRSRR